MLNLLLIAAGFLLLFATFLFFYQRKMIYFPRRYDTAYAMRPPGRAVEIHFTTSQGAQTAFYFPPRGAADPARPPRRLWILFHGNASLALDWLDLLEPLPDDEEAQGAPDAPGAGGTAFFLFDYPGYGACEGRPGRKAILESQEAAWRALAAHLGRAPDLEGVEINLLGYSLGSAAALDFAANHPPRRLILLAPFTSTLDMARLTVGEPLCRLLVDRFDNRARLAELAGRAQPPEVHIFHGDADNVVPWRMGRELADAHPAMITFHNVPRLDHNWLVEAIRKDLRAFLFAPATAESE